MEHKLVDSRFRQKFINLFNFKTLVKLYFLLKLDWWVTYIIPNSLLRASFVQVIDTLSIFRSQFFLKWIRYDREEPAFLK